MTNYRKTAQINHYNGLSTVSKPSDAQIGSTFYEYDTNDTYFTPDGASWYVKDSKSVKMFSTFITASAAAAYASLDVITTTSVASAAATFVVSGAAAYNGGTGEIRGMIVKTQTDSSSIEPIVYVFNSTPNGSLIDNTANTSPTYSDVSTSIYMGRVDFSRANALGTAYAFASCLPLPFTTKTSADDLYYLLSSATAVTLAAASREIAIISQIKRN